MQTTWDVVIVGAGHNGLVAACYLAQAGLRVQVLERLPHAGGATLSQPVFDGLDARLSVYSYLVSLLPRQIVRDLRLRFTTRRRAVASYTPLIEQGGTARGLLLRNGAPAANRAALAAFSGSESESRAYQALDRRLLEFARIVWPTLTEPLPTKHALREKFASPALRQTWDALVERPLGEWIEAQLNDDALRGAVFTDAKIGVSTYPHDPSLLQNRVFLYHVIGQGTGEWRVPVGGMGALVDALLRRARGLGVQITTAAQVLSVQPGGKTSAVTYRQGEAETSLDARFVLFNCSSDVANRLLPGVYAEEQVEGSVFKINMLLRRLPRLKDPAAHPAEAFAGTFHVHEGYAHMLDAYRAAQTSTLLRRIPAEMYCHSLTDPSILGPDLRQQGWQTLTLFGLDVPYHWFNGRNDALREGLTAIFLDSINDFLAEDIRDCLALDAHGQPCIQSKTPLDLEQSLALPRGNIFHGNLSWPFAERDDDAGRWGVETAFPNVFLCGSSAKRGGAVSGIPGHNAARRVLEVR